MNKLRVGVILTDYMVPAWIRFMLEGIKDSTYADVTALAFADRVHGESRFSNKRYKYHFKLDQQIFRPKPNPWEESDIRKFLQNTQILGENLNERISRLKAMRLDVLLNLSLDELSTFLLDAARFGVWSLRSNDIRVTTNTEIGWLEVLNNQPTMNCDIEAQRMETIQVITGSVLAAHSASITLNQKSFLWRAAEIVPRMLKRLYSQGEQNFFATAKPANSAVPLSIPTAAQSMALAQKQIIRIFENKIWRRWFPHRWTIMMGKGSEGGNFNWTMVKSLIMPRGVFWADPFPFQRQDNTYIFFEEYVFKNKRGHIVFAKIGKDGKTGKPHLALEQPYHLSYPFIFEYRGEFYMLPETAENRSIELYRCRRFPDQWEFHKTIMPDVHAVDATLFEHSMRWWLFTNIAGKGGSTWDELHLFYSDNPLSEKWTPHPMNPIVSDVRSARPAGRIFRRDSGLIRPSQDSSLRYGYALTLNGITKLTINEYEEQLVERIEPTNDLLATHTYNRLNDLIVVDVLLKR